MLRKILVLCLFCLSCISMTIANAQSEKEVTSKIEAVTVYPSYAVVERLATLKLDQGERVLIFPGLPATLVEESVRATVDPKDAVRLEDVRIEMWFLESPKDLDVAKLEDEIQKLKTQDKELANRIAILNEKLGFLKSIKVASASHASENLKMGKINTNTWTTTLSFLDTNMSENFDGILQAEIQRGKIAEQLETLNKQLQRARTTEPRKQKTIYIGISAQHEVEASVRVSYLMREASWLPIYELRANTVTNELELSYFGNVRQKTGEDWEDVDLTLSTARPARGAHIPEITPWYLDIAWPMPRVTAKKAAPESPRYVIEKEEEVAAAPPPPSTAEAKGISVVFNITGKKQLPSGEDAEKILIMRKSLPVTFEYATVPKLSPFAYLGCKGQNDSEYPLLEGNTSVFVDGDYVGQSFLQNVAPNEELELSLGMDEGIRVERELAKKIVRRKGLLNKKIEEEHVFKIKIKNLKTHPCVISVKDQVPIARNASIEVKDIQLNPEPSEYDQEKGLLKWTLPLQPKEEKNITLGFTVSYSKGKRPQGLF